MRRGHRLPDSGTCQAVGSDVACPSDCDHAEHDGQAYCDPHGDDGDGTGSGSAGVTCASAADCAPGLECKTEWTGHGNSVSTCEAHGGDGGDDGSDDGSDDHGGGGEHGGSDL